MDNNTKTIITNVIGYAAGVIVVLSLVPQLIQILRTRASRDVSIATYICLLIAQMLWIAYSILVEDLRILVCNVACAGLTIIIVIFTHLYKDQKN